VNRDELMRWDELELMREDARRFIRDAKERKPDAQTVEGFCDYLEFVLCLVYAYGWKDAEEIVGIVPFVDGMDTAAVETVIAGKTFRERTVEQIDDLDLEGLLRVIDTEAHRDYNTGVWEAAKIGGATEKQWHTMNDGRVRDTHDYLEGVVVGIDDAFYTYDGDSAMFPGGFTLPENNVNCRCWVTVVR